MSLPCYNLGTLLDAVALNGLEATRTFTVGPDLGHRKNAVADYSKLILDVAYTHANNGTLSFTFTRGATVATATRKPTSSLVSGGNATLSRGGVATTEAFTGSASFELPFTIDGAPTIKCIVAHGGAPNANDVVTITGRLV